MQAIQLCTCTMPFCGEEHAAPVFADIAEPDNLDDWEGPALPEYSERDEEAYIEMLRDDMMIGAFGL